MSKNLTDIFMEGALKTESNDFEQIIFRLSNKRTIRLLHAAMGLSTEANEFLDALKKFIFYGKPLDEINLKEELGDSNWYQAIAIDELGSSYDEILTKVLNKLQKRYGSRFNEEGAINRNIKEAQFLDESKEAK